MSEEKINEPGVKPNVLPAMKWDEVLARAQRIADRYGFPPYTHDIGGYDELGSACLSDDAVAVISDFVYYWQPYLTLKAKPNA